MQTSIIAEAWLYSVLTGDSELMGDVGGVYVDSVPGEPPSRYVLITAPDLADVSYVGGHIGWGTALYAVRAVGQVVSYSPLIPASKRIHALLHRQRGSTEYGKVIACYREQPFRMTEYSGDRQWRHLGGIYRLTVQD